MCRTVGSAKGLRERESWSSKQGIMNEFVREKGQTGDCEERWTGLGEWLTLWLQMLERKN